MDNLEKDVAKAKKAGMSYGRWKALQPQKKVKNTETRTLDEKVELHYCIVCGKPIPHWDKRRRICSPECRYKRQLQLAHYNDIKKRGQDKAK